MKKSNIEAFIVLIPLSLNCDARKQCELIEGTHFELIKSDCLSVKTKVIELIDDNTYDLQNIEVWKLNEFSEWCNDEKFNPDNYFMSYVYATYKNNYKIIKNNQDEK